MREEVRRQPAEERKNNFNEVSLGFTDKQAKIEARRCLQCKQPKCVEGCPVEIDIPGFINLILKGKRKDALMKIKEKNNLPAICGRVCPQENQCEERCILVKKGEPINIGALERYASDCELGKKDCLVESSKTAKNLLKGKVIVAGSGPAGLTAAADLAKMGYQVSLFESLHIAAGVLSYGIPEFRLPKLTVKNELNYIKSLGVNLKTDILVGRTITLSDLFQQGALAIFLALGAGLPQFMGISGESLGRVYSANEFLTRINLMKAYLFPGFATPINIGKRVAVIGAGNVAFDCARVAIRMGRNTQLIYRRSKKEMPARLEEIHNAEDEGLEFRLLTQPLKIIQDKEGFVQGMECIKMELGEPDSSGRRRPVPLEGSNFILDVDTVIVAIGQKPNPLVAELTPGLRSNPNGTIWVNDNLMTSLPGVFAGGDIITGADTVISAMGAGKKAAREINKYIKSKV
ncbi:MAG: NADPH-dependent glutamate synthase [Candidatus Omnitrophica bacterium]|nr:NADPH-dependent glutamate synthase [Candidatus Omnitrophota bacterium]